MSDQHPPPPIEHRPLENHYTKSVSYIAQCTSTYGRTTPHPPQLGRDALNITTPNLADLPPQSSIDALNTTTLNLAHLLADLLPQSIEHRSLEYYYTKLGRSTSHQSNRDALHTVTPNLTDLLADLPASQLSIVALNTATPNLADLLADLPPVYWA